MKTILLIFLVAFISCAHTVGTDRSHIIGKDLKTYKYGKLYFSRQPKGDEYLNLKKEGIVTVINLRDPEEYNEAEEKKILQKLGIEYFNIPFSKGEKLTDEYISSVTKVVMDNRAKGELLIHCTSGNRVGIWLGGHFFKDHKYSKEDSVIIAEELGMTSTGARESLKEYLNRK